MEVTAHGIDICYDDRGTGKPALLFLPGWCVNRTVFHDLALLCGARHRVLAPDLPGHGESAAPQGDFGTGEVVDGMLAVIEASKAQQVVPVAMSHTGWIAIELRRRLGERIPRLVLLDWLILEAPLSFLGALQGMQSPERWRQTVEEIFGLWLHGVENPRLTRFVREEMGGYGFAMWARAAREIGAAFRREGSPLQALARLDPPVPVLHLYAQPDDAGYLTAQRSFAALHPWFRVRKLKALSHFPMLEVPDEMAAAIGEFAG